MKTIKSWLLLILGSVILLNLAVGYYVMYQNGTVNDLIRNTPTTIIDSVRKTSRLNELSNTIQYLDEVLTQSARNYAYTGDITWKTRYNEKLPILDTAINEVITNSDDTDKKTFEDLNDANEILVRMETQSIAFTDSGNKLSAQAILNSHEYSQQKNIYSSGLDDFHTKMNRSEVNAISVSLDKLNVIHNKTYTANTINGFFIGILITTVVLVAIIIFIYIFFAVIKPINRIKIANKEIAKGNLEQRVNIKSRNEIGELAESFNQMAVKLKEATNNVESKVASRTDELQKLNHYMTGRELKMIELKQQLKELKEKHEISK